MMVKNSRRLTETAVCTGFSAHQTAVRKLKKMFRTAGTAAGSRQCRTTVTQYVASGLLYYVAQSFLQAGSIFGLDQYVRSIKKRYQDDDR